MNTSRELKQNPRATQYNSRIGLLFIQAEGGDLGLADGGQRIHSRTYAAPDREITYQVEGKDRAGLWVPMTGPFSDIITILDLYDDAASKSRVRLLAHHDDAGSCELTVHAR